MLLYYRALDDLFDLSSSCPPDPHTLCPAVASCIHYVKALSWVLYTHSIMLAYKVGDNIPI